MSQPNRPQVFDTKMLGRRSVPSSKSCSRHAPATQRPESTFALAFDERAFSCVHRRHKSRPFNVVSSPLLLPSYTHTLHFSPSSRPLSHPASVQVTPLTPSLPFLSFHLHRSRIPETRPRLRASCAYQQPTSIPSREPQTAWLPQRH